MDYSKKDCPFCFDNLQGTIIVENAKSFAIYDLFPVTNGHTLIITKRHIKDFFDTTLEEKISIFDLLNRVKKILDKKYKPDGYNVGVNIHSAAGQTISHVHVHLIPRYKGDVKNPIGGVRHVIPGKGVY